MGFVIGIPKESTKGENRVALDPMMVEKIAASGYPVVIQKDAGKLCHFPDKEYKRIAGVSIADSAAKVWKSDLIIKIQPPTAKEAQSMKKGAAIISYIYSHQRMPVLKKLAQLQVSVLAMEMIPRITRAQSMDTLSSQAAIAGYKAVLRAADLAPVFFPMLTYAAGSIRPAKVLVIGTGVAGLQAIATAKRLGAQVEAYDVRPETKEQVESLGAKFVHIDVEASGSGGYARELTKEEIQIQQNTLAQHISRSNVVITTAAVPGRPAPKIVSSAMVSAMAPGSVIIDLGAEGGGNVAVTKPGMTIDYKGIKIAGLVNVASDMPVHASEMYGKNIYNLLMEILNNGRLDLSQDNEIISGCLLTKDGEFLHPSLQAQETPVKARKGQEAKKDKISSTSSKRKKSPTTTKTESSKKQATETKTDKKVENASGKKANSTRKKTPTVQARRAKKQDIEKKPKPATNNT